MTDTLHGFIFLNFRGEYLMETLQWFLHPDHPEIENANVHARNVVDIVELSKKWKYKPTHFIPASWDGKKVVITGKKQETEYVMTWKPSESDHGVHKVEVMRKARPDEISALPKNQKPGKKVRIIEAIVQPVSGAAAAGFEPGDERIALDSELTKT